jgi:hypothetical protein
MAPNSARKSLNSPVESLRILFTTTGFSLRIPFYTTLKPPAPILLSLENPSVAIDKSRYSTGLSRVADPKESRVRANMHHDTTDQISTTTNNASSAAPLIINCLLTAEIKLVHYLVIAIAYIGQW